ncbi:hypothetical protein PEDI_24500 [Persicobacter diffluens]|uniref:SIMPL domain-containing protein n=2 Tax=Persicobacter diffluens TaxID=981 RepID=A0AAN4VY78_9BACT|nr:hypothetical protein PEDI_24500 [Persicobacter diffluens]
MRLFRKLSAFGYFCTATTLLVPMRITAIIPIFLLMCATAFGQIKNPRENTIMISGQGTYAASPDWVKVTVSVEGKNEAFNLAFDQLNQISQKLQQALKDQGIKNDQIFTSNYQIEKDFQYNPTTRKNEDMGFLAKHQINVEIPLNNDQLKKIITTVSNTEGNARLTVSFSIKDLESARNKALVLAVQDAKAKALTICKAANLSLGEIKQIDYGQTYNRPVPYASVTMDAMKMDRGAYSDPGFNPKDISVTENVNILYNLEK